MSTLKLHCKKIKHNEEVVVEVKLLTMTSIEEIHLSKFDYNAKFYEFKTTLLRTQIELRMCELKNQKCLLDPFGYECLQKEATL